MSRAEALSTAAPVQLTRQVFGNVPGWAQTAFYLLAVGAVGIWLYGIARRMQLWRKRRHQGPAVNWKMAAGRLVRDVILQHRIRGGGAASLAHILLFSGFFVLFIGTSLISVEHLLAALRGLAVDNVFIEVDNLEIPIMDGSAENFAEIIERAGVVEQPLARRALLVREKVSFEQGNRRISVEPADTYQIDCLIDFTHPLIGVQSLSVELSDGAFSREIAAARTFGFTHEIETLRRANLIRGGSLDNAIVLTPQGMLNQTGLRFRDEFVRHKILDIIGDLALLGMPILGRVVAERSGHILHAGLMSKLLRVRSAWDIVDMPGRMAA